MTMRSLNAWKNDEMARRIADARAAAAERAAALPPSEIGRFRQNAAMVLGFVARHRAKAATSTDGAYRKRLARDWLASVREERLARAASENLSCY